MVDVEERAKVLAQIAATLAIGQRAEHNMTPDEAARLVRNAEILLSAAEQADEGKSGDSGHVYRQAMERFGHKPGSK